MGVVKRKTKYLKWFLSTFLLKAIIVPNNYYLLKEIYNMYLSSSFAKTYKPPLHIFGRSMNKVDINGVILHSKRNKEKVIEVKFIVNVVNLNDYTVHMEDEIRQSVPQRSSIDLSMNIDIDSNQTSNTAQVSTPTESNTIDPLLFLSSISEEIEDNSTQNET